MSKYGFENFQRFQRSGVTEEDIRILKAETVKDAFLDVKEDMHTLVKELAPGIKEGRWTAILGDDVSGRFVASIVRDLATHYSQEHDQKGPEVFFVAGGGITPEPEAVDWSQEQLEAKKQEQQTNLEVYIAQIKDKLGDRVLITTEQIRNGSTIKRLGKILKDQGIDFDVASMWTADTVAEHAARFIAEDSYTFEGTKIYSGQENASASDPFGSEVSSVFYKLGVVLNEATGVKKANGSPVTEINSAADRNLVKLAREESAKLSEELYEDIFQE